MEEYLNFSSDFYFSESNKYAFLRFGQAFICYMAGKGFSITDPSVFYTRDDEYADRLIKEKYISG